MGFRLFLIVFWAAALQTLAFAQQPQVRIVGGQVTTDDYPYMAALLQRNIQVSIADSSESQRAIFLIHSPEETFSGRLVSCGVASSTCDDVRDAVCLIARDGSSFTAKARNCEAGGGVGAVIYNTYGDAHAFPLVVGYSGIPVVSVSRDTGAFLMQHAQEHLSVSYTSADDQQSFCGGVYIGNSWVVTAAHCISEVLPESIAISFGSGSLADPGSQVIPVTESFVHTGYDENTVRWDFALLKLAQDPGVMAASIPSADLIDQALIDGRQVFAMGRGQRTAVGLNETLYTAGTPELYAVAMGLVGNAECNRAYSGLDSPYRLADSAPIKSEMLCAGAIEGGYGTCFGDSGGPLVWRGDGRDYVFGVTSWGLGCAQAGVYDVFARMSAADNMIAAALSGAAIPGVRVTRSNIDNGLTTGDEIITGTGGIGFIGLWLMGVLAMFRRVKPA